MSHSLLSRTIGTGSWRLSYVLSRVHIGSMALGGHEDYCVSVWLSTLHTYYSTFRATCQEVFEKFFEKLFVGRLTPLTSLSLIDNIIISYNRPKVNSLGKIMLNKMCDVFAKKIVQDV